MNHDNFNFENIGHTHSHVSSEKWRELLRHDLHMSIPLIYAMSDEEREKAIKFSFERIVDVDQASPIEIRDLLVSFNTENFDISVFNFIDSCDRLGVSHVVDHWVVTNLFELLKNSSYDFDVSVGVSASSFNCQPLWDHIAAFAKNNKNIVKKVIIVLNLRNYYPSNYNINYWAFRVRQMGFRVGFDFRGGFDDAYRIISANRPDLVRFHSEAFVDESIKIDADITRVRYNMRRLKECTNALFIARGVYDEQISATCYACGLKMQQGSYWNSKGFDESPEEFIAPPNPVLDPSISGEEKSEGGQDGRKFFKGVLYSVGFSVALWSALIFGYIKYLG